MNKMKVSWDMGFFSFTGEHKDMMRVHENVPMADVFRKVEALSMLGFNPSVEMLDNSTSN